MTNDVERHEEMEGDGDAAVVELAGTVASSPLHPPLPSTFASTHSHIHHSREWAWAEGW